jgi:hypothetical protein
MPNKQKSFASARCRERRNSSRHSGDDVSFDWPIVRLGDVCDIARGGSPRPIQDYMTTDPNGVNWIKISDATASGKYIFETAEKIRPEGIKRSRLVNEGDFLLSNSMSFGRPYIMKTTGCIHDGWLVISNKHDLRLLIFTLAFWPWPMIATSSATNTRHLDT